MLYFDINCKNCMFCFCFLASTRLLLLLQSFNAYVEQIRCSPMRDQTMEGGYLSVSLVIRNYWSNLIKFAKFKVFNYFEQSHQNYTASTEKKLVLPLLFSFRAPAETLRKQKHLTAMTPNRCRLFHCKRAPKALSCLRFHRTTALTLPLSTPPRGIPKPAAKL